jgi:hypothetical protein
MASTIDRRSEQFAADDDTLTDAQLNQLSSWWTTGRPALSLIALVILMGFVRMGKSSPAADATMYFWRKPVCRRRSTG